MSQSYTHEEDHSKTDGPHPSEDLQPRTGGDLEAVTVGRLASSIRHMSTRGNGSPHAATMLHAQRTHSNRAVQRVVQRMAQEGSSSAETEPVLPHSAPASALTGTGLKSGRVSVQRAFWNGGKDLENDFWGTKEVLGKRWGGTADAASSAVWNLASAIPGIGTAVGGVSTAIDLAKAGTSYAMGDNRAANRFKNDAEFDAMGMIPVVGDGAGVLAGGYDASIAIGRAFGADPENETPLSSDLYHKIPDMFGPRVIPVEDLPVEGGGADGGFDAGGSNQTPLFPGPFAPELLNDPSFGGGDAGGPNQTPIFPGPLAPEFLDFQ